ncbi:hypothetical protein KZO96_05695 [Bifidobacterium pseudocatenulatum]|uniref:hypothetical protein n=1 Tax=Bifidobacterium pseudocatenulatum TaxID=28026 RepID=UPI001CFCFFA8|nr:hypothetical protein [Bifidobacterium pseudocatenulatum]MCB4887357.1 hypothetical protein [Bifidobacterium pseudocatenulatum]MCB4898589.1 hypothetical protein [Bifidobacterium pseudocatenulatum]
MITRSVTVAKIRREYWEQIADGRKQFELRDEEVEATSQAFVFVDASTGEHLGNARIISCTTFGGYENSTWSWRMLSKLVDIPVAELKKLFPVAAKLAAAPSEYEMHLYEITPISDDELLHGLFADPARPSDVTG